MNCFQVCPSLLFCIFNLNVISVFGDEPKIVIIGAGASGIAAASKLLENGLNNITIFEAEDRIGGRIFTTKLGDYWVDLGGQWVHGEDGNPVYDIAWPLGLLENSDKHRYGFEFFSSSGEKPLNADQTKNITNFFYKVENSPKEFAAEGQIENMGDIFRRAFKKYFDSHPELTNYKHQLLHLFELLTLSVDSAPSWNEIVWTDQWGFSGDHGINWKEKGYSMILDILMKKFPDPSQELPVMEKIKLNTEVVKIDYKDMNENVKLHTKYGEIIEADHVIITPSLGVLKATHGTLFEPGLSQQKKHFIENFGFGNVAKIFLLFENSWWNENPFATNIMWNDEDRRKREHNPEKEWQLYVTGFIRVEHKPKVLCMWVIGKGSQQVETISEEKLMPQINELLHIFNKSYNVTSPIKIIRTQWFTNSHFRGTYSYNSFSALRNHANMSSFAEPITHDNPKILFAGEATDKRSFSTVHGAIAAGWREANRLIKLYQKST